MLRHYKVEPSIPDKVEVKVMTVKTLELVAILSDQYGISVNDGKGLYLLRFSGGEGIQEFFWKSGSSSILSTGVQSKGKAGDKNEVYDTVTIIQIVIVTFIF